jgi:hypothetical protein
MVAATVVDFPVAMVAAAVVARAVIGDRSSLPRRHISELRLWTNLEGFQGAKLVMPNGKVAIVKLKSGMKWTLDDLAIYLRGLRTAKLNPSKYSRLCVSRHRQGDVRYHAGWQGGIGRQALQNDFSSALSRGSTGSRELAALMVLETP